MSPYLIAYLTLDLYKYLTLSVNQRFHSHFGLSSRSLHSTYTLIHIQKNINITYLDNHITLCEISVEGGDSLHVVETQHASIPHPLRHQRAILGYQSEINNIFNSKIGTFFGYRYFVSFNLPHMKCKISTFDVLIKKIKITRKVKAILISSQVSFKFK